MFSYHILLDIIKRDSSGHGMAGEREPLVRFYSNCPMLWILHLWHSPWCYICVVLSVVRGAALVGRLSAKVGRPFFSGSLGSGLAGVVVGISGSASKF